MCDGRQEARGKRQEARGKSQEEDSEAQEHDEPTTRQGHAFKHSLLAPSQIHLNHSIAYLAHVSSFSSQSPLTSIIMSESQAKVLKLSLPLTTAELGRLIRRVENHEPSENTLTVTFAQEHVTEIDTEDTPTKPPRNTKRGRNSNAKKSLPCKRTGSYSTHPMTTKTSPVVDQVLGKVDIANLTLQEAADLISIMCPADLAGLNCTKPDCKSIRRCESMQEYESIPCAEENCTFVHGLKISCPEMLEKRGCVRSFLSQKASNRCQNGHDHRAARIFNYEGLHCHETDVDGNKDRGKRRKTWSRSL
ncbi:hypothetical protein BDV28DRAFT_148019 [Aspergillus coremiiformis]|uniref:Uncharacterized protein n=1 Tax=Aspergillus coremiiformis TaxID=138285 RepID=A0A5N6Z9W9_9EURO|nr:hypothetical protein BDV28DRAFT_148019 [Aspergillus coremiiformis]